MTEHLALLASDVPVDPLQPTTRVNGARIATTEALRAIFIHGTFDAYDVFVQEDHAQDPAAYIAQWAQHGAPLERVRFIPLPLVRQALQTRRYVAVHDPSSPRLARLASLVRPLAPEPTPLTATVHSLSYANLIPQFIDALVIGLQPFDSTFCTSSDARATLQHILTHLTSAYQLSVTQPLHRFDLAPLGVDTAYFAPTLNALESRRILGLDPDYRYLLYFGRLSPFDKADLDVLLRAFAHLLSQRRSRSLRLILAGDDTQRYSGFLRSRAQQLGCAPEVLLFPDVSGLQKRLLLWATDIFVSPADSLQESFGIAVIEAMAAGLPVVVSDWGGYRDIVEEGVQGFRIPTIWGDVTSAIDIQSELGNFVTDHVMLGQGISVDEESLLQRLSDLLEHEEQRQAMSAAALKRAKLFDWSSIVQRYESLWRELKQEALQQTLTERPPVRFPFGELFTHYPTHLLAPDDLIERRPGALQNPPVAPQIKQLLPDTVFERLLGVLQNGPQRVKTLARNEQERLALLWLLKAGLLRIRKLPPPREAEVSH
ncbi:MAG: glycosyltransferase family 4 protein [Chloroflexi bacterium]|nr:glycosyltransferase family 4 protein [Chloroflexota bacterium]